MASSVPVVPGTFPVPVLGALSTDIDPDEGAGWETAVRTTLTDLGRQSRVWTEGDLGKLVAVERVRFLHAWTAARVLVTETRDVVDAFEPYRNERLPKQTVRTAGEVNPIDYVLFVDDADEGQQHADVEGSAREVNCHQCTRGRVACPDCGKQGKVECGGCGGSGRVDCAECSGDGRVRVKDEWGLKTIRYKNCPECRGSGKRPCGDCSRGRSTCKTCDGKKTAPCPTCDGMGKAIQVLRVVARRRRQTEQRGLHHADLEPHLNVMAVERIYAPPTVAAVVETWERRGVVPTEVARPSPPSREEALADEVTGGMFSRLDASMAELELSSARAHATEQAATMLPELVAKWKAGNLDYGSQVGFDEAISALGVDAGWPVPPIVKDARTDRRNALDTRFATEPDVARAAEYRADAGTLIAGRAPRVPLAEMGPSIALEFLAIISPINSALPSRVPVGTTVVREYLVVFRRSWVCFDYSFTNKSYQLFIGNGVFAPTGTPLTDAPDRLMEAALACLEEADFSLTTLSLAPALADPHRCWPSSELLASFMTAIPSSKIRHEEKVALLDLIGPAIEKRSELLPFFDPGLGRADGRLLEGVREQLRSAAARRRAIRVAVVVGVVLAALVIAVALSIGPTNKVGNAATPTRPSDPVRAPSSLELPAPASSKEESLVATGAPFVPVTYCGSDLANTTARKLPAWASWSCMEKKEAGKRWARCLKPKKYASAGIGACDGDTRCCPPAKSRTR